MGIAIMLFAVPAYCIFAVLSGTLADRFAKDMGNLTPGKAKLLGGFGFAGGALFVLVTIWLLPSDRSNGWGNLFTSIGLLIVGPVIVGLALKTIGMCSGAKKPYFSQLAVGALWATIALLPGVPMIMMMIPRL